MTIDGGLMQVGEVRVAKSEDFEQFRRLAESTEKWSTLYDRHGIKVYSKFTEGISVKMMKVSYPNCDLKSRFCCDFTIYTTTLPNRFWITISKLSQQYFIN